MIKKTTLQLLFILLLPLIGFTQPTQFIVLDGSQSILIPDSDSINDITLINRTVEFWFRVDDSSSATRQVIYKERASATGINFYVQSGKLYLGMYNDNQLSSNTWWGSWFRKDIESHVWYHVALVLRDGSTGAVGTDELEWYLNGNLQEKIGGGRLYKNAGNISIGKNDNNNKYVKNTATWVPKTNGDVFEAVDEVYKETMSGGLPFSGMIGNFRIWNSARTQTQIDSLKNIKLTTLNNPPEYMVAYLDGNRVKYIQDDADGGGSDYTLPAGIVFPSNEPGGGDTFTWKGNTNNEWTTDSNWADGTAPDVTKEENIVIATTGTTGTDPNVPGTLNANNLTVKDGSIFDVTISNSQVNVAGDLVVETGASLNFQGTTTAKILVSGKVTNGGVIDFEGTHTSSLEVDGDIDNTGTIEFKHSEGHSFLHAGGAFTNDTDGMVRFASSTDCYLEADSFTNKKDAEVRFEKLDDAYNQLSCYFNITNDLTNNGIIDFTKANSCSLIIGGNMINDPVGDVKDLGGEIKYGAILFRGVNFSEIIVDGNVENKGLISFDSNSDGITSSSSGFTVKGDLTNDSGVDFPHTDFNGVISFVKSYACGFHVLGHGVNKKGSTIKFEEANGFGADVSEFTVTKTFENYGLVTFLKARESGFTVAGTFKNDADVVGGGTEEIDGAVLFQHTRSCGFEVKGLLTNNKGSKIRFNGASVTGTQSELRALGGMKNYGLVSFGTYNDGGTEVPSKNSGFKVKNGDLLNEFPTGGTVGIDGLISFISSESCGFHVTGNATNKLGSIIKFEDAKKVGDDPSEFTVSGTIDNFGEITFEGTNSSGFSVDGTLTNTGDGDALSKNGLISFRSSLYSGIISGSGINNTTNGIISFDESEGDFNTVGLHSEIRVTTGNIINDGLITLVGSTFSGINILTGFLQNNSGSTIELDETSYINIPNGTLTSSGNTVVFKSSVDGTSSLISEASIGNFEFQRYHAFTGWGDFSSPTYSSPSSIFTSSQVYKHTETSRATGDPYTIETGNLTKGEGYLVNVNDLTTYSFSGGSVNGGDFTYPLTSTEYNYAGVTEYYGWNLIGNPYPSAITWRELLVSNTNANLNKTLYLLDGGNKRWITFNGSSPPLATDIIDTIPVGQAFFVQAMDGNNFNFTFTQSSRIHNTNNINFGDGGSLGKKNTTKKGARDNSDYPYPFVHLKVSTSSSKNDIATYVWRDNATNDFDAEFDGYKLTALAVEQPNVYFFSGDNKTSIQQEPE
ncbi:MAG: LamG domain-containing protein, partial [Flavobacteriales bacterium]|nr:LamG domain-containing protein [Flavobacteriales bacterium]